MGFWVFASGAGKASDLVFLRGSGRWIGSIVFGCGVSGASGRSFLLFREFKDSFRTQKRPKARRPSLGRKNAQPSPHIEPAKRSNVISRQQPSLGLRDS